MKNKIVCTLLLVVSLSLCACSSDSKSGKVSDVITQGSDKLTMDFTGDYDDYDYDDESDEYYEDEVIEHDEPYVPESYDGFIYKSTLNSLGKYTGLTYTYESSHTVTADELEEEIESMLESYELKKLTDSAAVEMGYENVNDLKEQLTAELSESYVADSYSTAASDLLEKIISASSFTIDPSEVESVYNEQIESYEEMASFFGVSFEELCTEFFGMSVEDLSVEVRNDSETSIKTSLLVNAILKDAGLDMKTLWDTKSMELLKEYGYDNAWEYIDYYADEITLMEEVKYKTIVDYLMEKNTNTAK